MPCPQTIFKRVEKKYWLTPIQYQMLLARLEPKILSDRYAHSSIRSLYFDTNDFQLIRTSIEKPVYKEKLRLRCYGLPEENDEVFLELKKKFRGVVYKRRAVLPYRQANDILETGDILQPDTQILREIRWFMNRYPTLAPRVWICYDRFACYAREDPQLRITFDSNIRWSDHDLCLSSRDSGTLLTDRSGCLMEIKIPGAMPVWLAQLLSELRIFPTSFSKYGTCYQQHLSANRRYPLLCSTVS